MNKILPAVLLFLLVGTAGAVWGVIQTKFGDATAAIGIRSGAPAGESGYASLAGAGRDSTLWRTATAVFGRLEPVDPEALLAPDVLLGRSLFWDERISADGRTACASCHTAAAWSSDARRYSLDARGERTGRHSQPVFNAMVQPSLRWAGDRRDGAHQAERSIVGSRGFATAEAAIPVLIRYGYESAFREAFPDDPEPVSAARYGQALQAYQRTLVTPAPFDAYLAGDLGALTSEQERGLAIFVSSGCAGCHGGALLGGQSLQKFGIVTDYWTVTGSEIIDSGRHVVTGEEGDRYVFRTPMLRNVVRTAPYFHDGSVASLRDAVRAMATVQLGRTLTEEDVDLIVAFLEALTGEIPAHYGKRTP